MLPFDGFGQYAFDEITTSLKMVDDCGSAWNCDLIYVTFPFKHYRIGGEWSRIVAARRLTVGRSIRCSAQAIGQSDSICYVEDLISVNVFWGLLLYVVDGWD
jgi:hypothetical protein